MAFDPKQIPQQVADSLKHLTGQVHWESGLLEYLKLDRKNVRDNLERSELPERDSLLLRGEIRALKRLATLNGRLPKT